MNINIIVGNKDTRKSSTIRALTGIGSASIYDITYSNKNVLPTLVIPSALQELYKISPKDFIDAVENRAILLKRIKCLNTQYMMGRSFNDILICLHETGENGYSDANTYIDAFLRAGWIITDPIISFNSGYTPPIPFNYINSVAMPANEIANNIRKFWGWL